MHTNAHRRDPEKRVGGCVGLAFAVRLLFLAHRVVGRVQRGRFELDGVVGVSWCGLPRAAKLGDIGR